MVTTQVSIPGYQVNKQLYNSSRTLVYRGYRETDSLPVVIKLLKNAYPSVSELVQFRNQYTIAKNLNSPLIIQTYCLEPYQNGYILVMEDFGGISLKDYLTTVERLNLRFVEEFLHIGIALCDTLNILEHERIIHKDIKPSNILINPETKQIKLIDFSIASLLPKETQTLINPNLLEGTLAYISPEQTGRMNRAIDYRTDFYSSGVTFYELLTGELPFQSKDLMELLHCHIAKLPPNMNKSYLHKAPFLDQREGSCEVSFRIPQVLSDIVMKLMAKNAEDRYQSAFGLKSDLENCLEQLKETGTIETFPIAQRDVCDRFVIPEKLYGRETEVQTLLTSFNRVSQGNTEMMLVAGFSGIGKTVVVNEVHKPIVRQRSYFIKGKYDQFQRNIPFSAFVQAFRNLMEQLISESDAQLQVWKTKIKEAVGENGQVLIEVIPELEGIIGKQPPVPELSGNASGNRFNLLIQKFVQVFTSIEQPLVIFLDDLQWADSASLKLLQLLMEETEHLLVLGAYRDNEVSPTHPFILTVDEIIKTGVVVNTITLQPLSLVDMNQLVADTLNCDRSLAQPFTELVYQKTKGNPFFTTQFLKALHEDGQITFNSETRHWQCDITQVRALALTDDVVEFMALQLQKLPTQTQDALKLAACIGAQFDLATLAIISEKSPEEAAIALWKALQEGVIIPHTEVYKFFIQSDSASISDAAANPIYRFLHDRLQQAAYSLIPGEQKQITHYQIGQLLLQQIFPEARVDRIFELVNQLNYGKFLITQQTERDELAHLNLMACRKAISATAYQAARDYAAAGLSLLGENPWQQQYKMTLALHELAAEVTYLIGDFEQMEPLIEVVLQNTTSILDRTKVYEVKILSYIAQNRQLELITMILPILQQLGVHLPDQSEPSEFETRLTAIKLYLRDQDVQDLVNLPILTIPEKIAAIRILAKIWPACYQLRPDLSPLIVMEQVYLSLRYGNSDLSPFAYATFGLILIGVVGDIELGYQFGQIALKLLRVLNSKAIEARTSIAFYNFVFLWKQHLKETLKPFLMGYSTALETGDLEWAGYGLFNYCVNAYFSGFNLNELNQTIEKHVEFIQSIKQEHTLNYINIFRQAVLNLLGHSTYADQLIGKAYNREVKLRQYIERNDPYPLFLTYLHQSILCYLFCNYVQALEYSLCAEQYLGTVVANIGSSQFYFQDSLTHLALYKSLPKAEKEATLTRVKSNQEKVKKWASHAPMNYLHKVHLVEAEKYRVLGKNYEAMEMYDQAIALAKANGYTQEEALSNELAAKFYLDWGKEKIAQAYMQEAYYCYTRWGALAKVHHLEKIYPKLLQSILQQQRFDFNPLETIALVGNSSPCTSNNSSTSISDVIDFTSVLRAAQAISSSLELDQLITSLTRIILENSGAKKAVLILPQGDTWQIRAITFINHELNSQIDIQTILEPQSLDNCLDIPVKIIHYVKNTQRTIVIDNCKTDIPGVIGKYMLENQPQSIFCTPILNQENLVGILYLENDLTPGVFTRDRLSVINLLSSQAAISLQNAQLYTNLQSSEARFQHLAENVPGMIYQFQLSPDGRSKLNYVSTGCDEIYEISSEQVVADANTLMSMTHPEDMAHYQESITISAQTLEPWRYSGRIITPSGEVKWIQAASRPIKQADGTVIWDGLLLDVTERKLAEAAVIQKSQELEKALEDLQQAQLQIVQSEKMSALGNLVAGVAHEMNNPLGFIAASLKQAKPTFADISEHLKLYQKSLPNPGNEIEDHAEAIDLDYSLEDLPQMIDSMTIACDRLTNISTSLRTFSRADKDYKVLFNIHEGIDSTILILKHRLKANEHRPAIEVITDYGDLPNIECFPGQFNQVFMNILANAIDALDESNIGRSFVENQADANRITIKTSRENECVKITIADNGLGMSEEVKQKVFDHLFTTKAVGKGTGLGLTIAKSIVESTHKGKLSFHSVQGKGTEFLIEIPTRGSS